MIVKIRCIFLLLNLQYTYTTRHPQAQAVPFPLNGHRVNFMLASLQDKNAWENKTCPSLLLLVCRARTRNTSSLSTGEMDSLMSHVTGDGFAPPVERILESILYPHVKYFKQ